MTGLGAATADALCAIIIALGLTSFSQQIAPYQKWTHFLGGFFLLFLGWQLLCKKEDHHFSKKQNKERRGSASASSYGSAYGTTFFLTIINPLTLFSFIALGAALGLGSFHQKKLDIVNFVLGVFWGSLSWWLLLSGITTFLLHRLINEKTRKLMDKISGLLFLILGVTLFFT